MMPTGKLAPPIRHQLTKVSGAVKRKLTVERRIPPPTPVRGRVEKALPCLVLIICIVYK